MDKYTNLVRKIEETEPQKKDVVNNLDNTYKHSILIGTANNTTTTLPDNDTNLRTTNLTNLTEQAGVTSVDTPSDVATPLRPYAVNAVIRCIHGTTEERCALCSGYVRWLIADEERLRRAQNNPEAARREFWRQAVDETVVQIPASFLAVPGENITVAELQARRDQGQNAVKAVKQRRRLTEEWEIQRLTDSGMSASVARAAVLGEEAPV